MRKGNLFVIFVATVVGLALIAFLAFLAYVFNGIASDTGSTLAIANRATNPQTQLRSYNGFLRTESQLFQKDCDAKAHQLTILDNDLGGHVTLAQMQDQCVNIAIPPITHLP